MAKLVVLHSFRGGTGKTTTTANVGALLAAGGLRVGVMDIDIQSPGLYALFGLAEEDIPKSLNNYLWGEAKIEEAALDVTPRTGANGGGKLYLIPSSIRPRDIARVLRDGFRVTLLDEAYKDLFRALALDVLIVDTHPGLNDEILLSMAVADRLLILLRPDQQDYHGTSISVKLAQNLEVRDMLLMVNKNPPLFNSAVVEQRVREAYGKEVIAVLPHSNDMLALGSAKLFIQEYPESDLTALFKQIAGRLAA